MTDQEQDQDQAVAARQRWMRVLARTPAPELERVFEEAVGRILDQGGSAPGYEFLRRPETGLVMVRGRMDATGRRFNLGEMTMTRCAVQVNGLAGFGYVAGRRPRHAELAALFDGLLQDEKQRDGLLKAVVGPLETRARTRQERDVAKTAATKVEFFTMVRGDDE